jgi:hypothetical protein
MTTSHLPQLHSPSIPLPIEELHRLTWESEFEKRLDERQQRTHRQSFLRFYLRRALMLAALSLDEMAARLDK